MAPAVSQATLAAMVGASRENVNRALAALAASGTITSVDGRYVIGRPDWVRRDVLAGRPLLPEPDDDDGARGVAK